MKLKPSLLRRLYVLLVSTVCAVSLTPLLRGELSWGLAGVAFLVAFFGLAALLTLVNLLPGSAALELTPAGMTIRSLYQEAFFAWSDVQEFFAWNTGAGRRVCWRHAAGSRAWTSSRPRNLATRFAAFKATLPDTYGYAADQLAALLNEWRLNHSAELSPGNPPGPAEPTAPAVSGTVLTPGQSVVEGKVMRVMLDPPAAEVLRRRGRDRCLAGEFEEALADLQQAQRLNPFSYDTHLDKAVALRFLGKFAEALQSCEAVLMLNSPAATLVLLHQLRGDVLRELDQPERALMAFQQSLDLNPDAEHALHPHQQKARLLAELGQRREALAACEAALECYPDDRVLRELEAKLRASPAPGER